MRRVLLGFGALCFGACEPEPEAQVATQRAAIIDGELARDYDEVVAVLGVDTGLCTGTLIDERVVLTAKHCVQRAGASEPVSAHDLSVGVGPDVSTAEWFDVASIVTTPGSYEDGDVASLRGEDVALVTLTRAPGIAPREVRFTAPSGVVGSLATAVGFGETQDGSSGTKFETKTTITDLTANLIAVEQTVCKGDSGGPLIGADGLVLGVASLGKGSGCSTGASYYNRLDVHRELILSVLEEPSTCTEDEHTCDGRDDDCDGNVDEGACATEQLGDLGDACADREDCREGLFCANPSRGQFCTHECKGATDCGERFDCEAVVNGFACLPQGSVVGGPCADDSECVVGMCSEVLGTCTRACRSVDECGPGLACIEPEKEGLCVRASDAERAQQQLEAARMGTARSSAGGCSVGLRRHMGAGAWCILALLGLMYRRRARNVAG